MAGLVSLWQAYHYECVPVGCDYITDEYMVRHPWMFEPIAIT